MDLQATNGRILSLCKEEIVKTEKIRDTRSQEAIRKAVLSLARHKPVEKISITEICREASVHRSTFYKYYGCQSDVVKDMLNRLILHTADHVMASLRGGSSIRDALVSALEYMAENQAQIGLLLKECDYSFFRDVKLSLPDFQMKLVSFFPSSMSQREKRAYASFIQYGTLHLVVEWLLGGCVISPQEEVNVIFSVLSKVMGSPLQNLEKMDDK